MKIVTLIRLLHSKPVRLSFIFGTQMKTFLMKYESFMYCNLHWQLPNWNYYIDASIFL